MNTTEEKYKSMDIVIGGHTKGTIAVEKEKISDVDRKKQIRTIKKSRRNTIIVVCLFYSVLTVPLILALLTGNNIDFEHVSVLLAYLSIFFIGTLFVFKEVNRSYRVSLNSCYADVLGIKVSKLDFIEKTVPDLNQIITNIKINEGNFSQSDYDILDIDDIYKDVMEHLKIINVSQKFNIV